MKMSGRNEVMATQGGAVGDAPPKSQCKIQSLAPSINLVAYFFFLLGSFAPALDKFDILRHQGTLRLLAADCPFQSRDEDADN